MQGNPKQPQSGSSSHPADGSSIADIDAQRRGIAGGRGGGVRHQRSLASRQVNVVLNVLLDGESDLKTP